VGETGLKRHVLVENVGSPTGLVGDRRVRADGRRRDRKAAQRRGCARIDEPIARPSRLVDNRPAGEVAGLKSRRWSRLPPSRPQEQSRRGPLPPRGRQPTGGFSLGTPFSRVQCPVLRGLQPSGVRVNLKRPFSHLRHRFLRNWVPATPRKLSAVAIPSHQIDVLLRHRLLPQPGGFEGSRGLRIAPQSRQAPVPKLEHPGETGAQARASKGAQSAV
jgi:hypothetical protein